MMLWFQNLRRDEDPRPQTKGLGPGGFEVAQAVTTSSCSHSGPMGASEGGAAAVTASHWRLWSKVGARS